MPMEAPVTTATLPASEADDEAIAVCIAQGEFKSRRVQCWEPRGKHGRKDEIVSALLPLFPLDLVLLPGVPLPLHIFEPRYKEMIAECLEQKREFGIIRAHDEKMATIGCSAEIINVLKKYPDGRMNILTEGRRRFEVLQVNQERSFLQADIFYLEDENEPPAKAEVESAMRLHGEIMQLAGAQPEQMEQAEASQLAYRLAGSLPFDPDFQQALLEMNSEPARMRAIISFFQRILPVLQRNARAKRKAGGNGHVS
jgi:Lon protease-like protein